MKKIIVEKNDDVMSVARKVRAGADSEVALVIPKNAALTDSLNNFHLLAREAEGAGKSLTVESVDEEALAFAKAAGIEAIHPFLGDRKRFPSLSDIVPRGGRPEEREVRLREAPPAKSAKKTKAAPEEKAPHLHIHEHAPEMEKAKQEREERREERRERRPHRPIMERPSARAVVVIFALGVVIGAGMWAAGAAFGKATVTLRMKTAPWQFQGTVTADTALSDVDVQSRGIPAELFTVDKNLTQLFPATGKQNATASARGRIVIYNAYNTKSQIFVASTRFATPDGKIFRLARQVTVPGAVLQGGNLIPATAEGTVVAAAAGDSYNLGPVPRLTIPGFIGSPRYRGFYGELPEGTSGGASGAESIATDQDIQSAKAKMASVLETAARGAFQMEAPQGFTVPDGASSFSVTKIAVNSRVDQNGNFSVFGEGTFTALGFLEDEGLKAFLLAEGRAEAGDGTLVFRDFTIQNQSSTPDFAKHVLHIAVAAQGTLAAPVAEDTLKANLGGLTANEAQAKVGLLPGLAEGKISLWPFWIGRIPESPARITIVVQ